MKCNPNEDQDEGVNVKKKEMGEEAKKQHQHQAPLHPSTHKSADSLSNNNKASGSHLKYKPRRKHGSRVGTTLVETKMFSSTDSSEDIQRQRKLRTLQDNAILNRSSSSVLSTSSSVDMMKLISMMSTGSIRDIKKRHIPSTNAEKRNEEWPSISNIGETASLAMHRPTPQMMMPSILSSISNVKNVSLSMIHHLPQIMPSMNSMVSSMLSTGSSGDMLRHSMLSTGSSGDMRRRRIHRTTAAEKQNQDWAATGSGHQGALLNPLNQHQQTQPSDNSY